MRSFQRIGIPISAALALALLAPAAGAQSTKPSTAGASLVKALDNAMNPGEAQKKLEPLVGSFDVKILTWVDPSKPPSESMAVAISKWELGDRYIQTMLAGFVAGEPFDAIGYAGYDNVAKKYVVTYMDSGSTGMEWYSGTMSPDGMSATLTATTHDAVTRKPEKVEMRLMQTPDGNHVMNLWKADKGGKMAKILEFQYTRKKS